MWVADRQPRAVTSGKRILVARPESDLAELANVTKIMTYVNPERTTAHDRSDTPQ